jgi:GxxExxY protein
MSHGSTQKARIKTEKRDQGNGHIREKTMNPADYAERGSLKHGEITEKVIGVFCDVYNELGFGLPESVYHKAMLIALQRTGLAVESKVPLPVFFRGQPVGDFEADIIVERVVILELKAADEIHPAHDAQLLNYLKASAAEVGLLLNFGPKPRFKRLVFDNERKRSRPNIESA